MSAKHMIISVNALHDADDNIRTDLEIDEHFVSSIREFGIVQPLIVQADGKVDGKQHYKIQAGHRRKYGAIEAGLGAVPCLVVPKAEDDQRTAVMLIENLQRADINPVDEYVGYQRLVAGHQWTAEEVARNVGASLDLVRRRLKWAKLPANVLDAVRAGTCNVGLADVLAALSIANIKKVTHDGAKVPTRWDIDSFQRQEEAERRARKDRKRFIEAGATVISADDYVALRNGESTNVELTAIYSDMKDPKLSSGRSLWNMDDLTGLIIVDGGPEARLDRFSLLTDGKVNTSRELKQHLDQDLTDYERDMDKFQQARDQAVDARLDAIAAYRREMLERPVKERTALLLELLIEEVSDYDMRTINQVMSNQFETRDQAVAWARESASNRITLLLACRSRHLSPQDLDERFPVPEGPDRDHYTEDGRKMTKKEIAAATTAADEADQTGGNDEASAESAAGDPL